MLPPLLSVSNTMNIEESKCPACGGPGMKLGKLGNLTWQKCRNCGMEFNTKKKREEASLAKQLSEQLDDILIDESEAGRKELADQLDYFTKKLASAQKNKDKITADDAQKRIEIIKRFQQDKNLA